MLLSHLKTCSCRYCGKKVVSIAKKVTKYFQTLLGNEQILLVHCTSILKMLFHCAPKCAFRYIEIYFCIYLEEGSKLWIVVINTRTINAHTKFDLNTSSRI